MTTHFQCRNQIIWLSGGTSGIGQALAFALAERKNTVYITARNTQALAQTCAAYPQHLIPLEGDVTQLSTLQQHAAHIQTQTGHLDLLILNAGTAEYVDTTDFKSPMFHRVFDVNFFGCVHMLEAALPLLRAGTPKIIAGVGSSVTLAPFSRAQAYGASKAALHYMLESLRVDLTPEGFSVLTVAPGFVKTPLTDRNDFPMPMILSSEKAAQAIIKSLERRQQHLYFPRFFCALLALIGHLPSRLRNSLMQRMRKPHTQDT